MKKDVKYKITFTGGEATVILTKIDTYPSVGLPSDYWFDYVEGSDKPLEHPDYPNQFVLPEGIVEMLVQQGHLIEI